MNLNDLTTKELRIMRGGLQRQQNNLYGESKEIAEKLEKQVAEHL